MYRLLVSTLLFINLSLGALETSEMTQKNSMLIDLDIIKKTFEYNYAPAEWKRELFGWDLQSQFQSAADEVKKNKGNDIKQFQQALIKLCKSTRDYHVSITFTSTEYASLPFDIRCRNGKYIITKAKKNENLPLAVGDEILTMDGIPIEIVVAKLQKELGEENKPATDRALALETLTRRNGRLGHQVPQGSVTIEVKKAHSDTIATYQVHWDYKPERVLNPLINHATKSIQEKQDILLEAMLNQKSTLPYYDEMSEVFSDDGNPSDLLGSRKSVFSTLGKEKLDRLAIEQTAQEQISWIWNWLWLKRLPEEAKKFFDARLIELPSGKRAGYVRIATYTEENPIKALKAFLSCIEFFQSEADVLLIDQTNNPGGTIVYMYALASALTDRPLEIPKDRRSLTQSDVLDAIETIDLFQNADLDIVKDITFLEFPMNEIIQNRLNEAHFILSQWKLGHLLTEPYPLFGMEVIKPHPRVHFTKPIFILVNEMAFSCGDVFPAIFQDNKRATIIGTPTAGAVGSPNTLSFANLNGVKQLKYSTAFAYRLDGTSLENIGVTPDLFFDFNNELYGKDNVSVDFQKIYAIIDAMMRQSDESAAQGGVLKMLAP